MALSSRSPALGVTQQAWPSGSPDFPQPTLKEIGRNHLACFQISSCLVGIIQKSGAVAQLERVFDVRVPEEIEQKFRELAGELAPDPLNVDRLRLNRLLHQTPDLPDRG